MALACAQQGMLATRRALDKTRARSPALPLARYPVRDVMEKHINHVVQGNWTRPCRERTVVVLAKGLSAGQQKNQCENVMRRRHLGPDFVNYTQARFPFFFARKYLPLVMTPRT